MAISIRRIIIDGNGTAHVFHDGGADTVELKDSPHYQELVAWLQNSLGAGKPSAGRARRDARRAARGDQLAAAKAARGQQLEARRAARTR